MATSLIQTRFDVGTESAELWRVASNKTGLSTKNMTCARQWFSETDHWFSTKFHLWAFYSTNTHFNASTSDRLWKHCGKRRNCSWRAIPTMFSTKSGNCIPICQYLWQHIFIRCCPVGVAEWWACRTHDPVGFEFETRLRQTFFPADFRLSPLLTYVRKVVGGFRKKVVLKLVWGSQETYVRHRPPWYDFSC